MSYWDNKLINVISYLSSFTSLFSHPSVPHILHLSHSTGAWEWGGPCDRLNPSAWSGQIPRRVCFPLTTKVSRKPAGCGTRKLSGSAAIDKRKVSARTCLSKMSHLHRTNCRVKPLKSHKSKQGVNMFFMDGILYYADAPVKKVIKYSVDDQDILATLYTKSEILWNLRRPLSFPRKDVPTRVGTNFIGWTDDEH